jgi:hypothetical protein
LAGDAGASVAYFGVAQRFAEAIGARTKCVEGKKERERGVTTRALEKPAKADNLAHLGCSFAETDVKVSVFFDRREGKCQRRSAFASARPW